MSASGFLKQLKTLRTKAKWWTLGYALAAITSLFVNAAYTDFSYGRVNDNSPRWLHRIMAISIIMSLLLGLFTFPRWYSFIALAAVVWIFFSAP
jgi:hypothetical protein